MPTGRHVEVLQMPLRGTTSSERYLSRLCDRTFLRLWSYPNLYRDQGRPGGKGTGKELCDLLVTFDKHVIIFSDKSCKFPDTSDLQEDWLRWYRRSIKKSADQVFGAERWIRRHPHRLFLDPHCAEPFPLDLPPADECRFHRIVVALNAKERCLSEIGGSGSLIIAPIPPLDEQSGPRPFYVGNVSPEKGFVHVLDDVTLDILLRQLDTVSDFVGYLQKKEDFVNSGRLLYVAGEEDLLGFYLMRINDSGEHDFVVPQSVDKVVIEQGFWSKLIHSPEYRRKKRADAISYLWDNLIDHMSGHAIGGTLVAGADQGLARHEMLFRVLAAEPRLARRALSRAFSNKIRSSRLRRDGKIGIEAGVEFNSPGQNDLAYAFVIVGGGRFNELPDYRRDRREILQYYVILTKHRYRALKRIVGIATDPAFVSDEERSVDMIYYDATQWNDADEETAKSFQKEFGLADADSIDLRHEIDSEYPNEND